MVRTGAYLGQPEGIRAKHLAGAVTLIPGVFQAILHSSVQQMGAYSELIRISNEARRDSACVARGLVHRYALRIVITCRKGV